ncbi:MAG: Tad domain-containing protein [Candidatus Limnocylindria bacterium]
MSYNISSDSARGQTLVIVAVAMVALVGMVGVVIDVGLQWADNRGSQNGSDATAEAGAIVLMEYMLGASRTDGDVLAAVEGAAGVNQIEIDTAEYTKWDGIPLNAAVGGGTIPAEAQGIRVVGTRIHTTFFARVVGIDELRVFTDAIAVTGPSDPCPAGGTCAFLPVTVPTTVVTCDGQNKSVATDDDWEPYVEYVIPLCGKNPGSVGWIDWTPPAGGDDELADEFCDPDPPPIVLPDWFQVTSTGNTNSEPVQSCFESHVGTEIMIPLFEDTCRSDPGESSECTDPAPIGGVNQWYYFPRAASLMLTGVYVKGSNGGVCDTGNGATSCITGYFVDTAIVGEVTGPWDPGDTSLSRYFAVQLIQ